MVSEIDVRSAHPPEPDWIRRALEHAGSFARDVEFVPDPAVQTTSASCRVVHLHQYHRGVPVFQAGCTLRFDPRGNLTDYTDNTLYLGDGIDLLPVLGAAAAARVAAAYLQAGWPQVKAARFKPKTLSAFAHPSCPTVLSQGPFADPVPAHLALFAAGPRARLAWCLTLTLPERVGEYDFLISADREEPPEIFYCRNIFASVVARGNVFTPFPPPAARRVQPFPASLQNLPRFLRATANGFPFDWVEKDALVGNCTSVHLRNETKSLRGTTAGGFLTFDPTQGDGDEQKMVNAFYFCNLMHDFFFGLGFDEAAGNFQTVNRTHAGRGGDCVVVRIFNTALNGHATMRSRVDGKPGEMRLGFSGNRHTALDPDVIIHEFTHGVTERTVGGTMDLHPLSSPQSTALAEGWSDYFALTFQSYGQPNEKVAFGDWIANRPDGLRQVLFDDTFPSGFGDLGRGRYQSEIACGEIWCAALMRMNREIGRALGNDFRRGHEIGWQIVFDGLKKLSSNPNFLQARNAIFEALDDLRSAGLLAAAEHGTAAQAARTAFAALGMGNGARSNGTSLTGNIAG